MPETLACSVLPTSTVTVGSTALPFGSVSLIVGVPNGTAS